LAGANDFDGAHRGSALCHAIASCCQVNRPAVVGAAGLSQVPRGLAGEMLPVVCLGFDWPDAWAVCQQRAAEQLVRFA
jgi:hypothetical protein